jgi:anti-sigma-K factor RskA
MRRLWATVVSVWAVLAIVAVLAWSRPATPSAQPQASPTVLVVKGKNGTQQLVVVNSPATPPHATTQTSPPPR